MQRQGVLSHPSARMRGLHHPPETIHRVSKVLVLYYTTCGQIEPLAQAEAEGARSTGAQVDLRLMPDLQLAGDASRDNFRVPQKAPVLELAEMEHYDAIIIGSPNQMGHPPAAVAGLIDRIRGPWMRGAFNDKVGGVFVCSATQHGGHEATQQMLINALLQMGMLIVGLPYSFQPQMQVTEVHGASPYGAGAIIGPQGTRPPTALDLEGAYYHGRRIAEVANKLFG